MYTQTHASKDSWIQLSKYDNDNKSGLSIFVVWKK